MRQFLTNCFQEQKRLSLRRTKNKSEEMISPSTKQCDQQTIWCASGESNTNNPNTMDSSTKRKMMRSTAIRVNNMSCSIDVDVDEVSRSLSRQRFSSINENAEKPLEEDIIVSPVRKPLEEDIKLVLYVNV